MPITTQQAQNALIVTQMYEVALNRLPDAEGLAWWLNDLDNGQTLQQVAHNICTNIEQFSYGRVDDIVNMLYQNKFGHDANPVTVNHWEILAINAVPVEALVHQMSIGIVGLPTESWAGALYLV